MTAGGADLKNWTNAEIAEQCRAAYNTYKRARNDQYTRYFDRHPELRGNHPLRTGDLATALPTGHEDLAELIEPGDLHREHLSANSSQILALALLGSAMHADRSLGWLFATLQPLLPPPGVGDPPIAQLEKTLAPETLGEQPRQTAVDFFVESRGLVLCVEAKWTEPGLGTCSCDGRATGECSKRVLGRATYWSTAERVFGLAAREIGDQCPIQAGYQAVRNAAAATGLSRRSRRGVRAGL